MIWNIRISNGDQLVDSLGKPAPIPNDLTIITEDETMDRDGNLQQRDSVEQFRDLMGYLHGELSEAHVEDLGSTAIRK